jgi:FkbM family methyltransferase
VLTLPVLPLTTRVHLTTEKYRSLAQMATGRPATIGLGRGRVRVRDTYELGTLLASIVDMGILAKGRRLDVSRPVIVDVGANIGQFCLASKLFWPDAKIMCFEPDPDVFADLTENTRHVSDVIAKNVGLGREPGLFPWHRHRLSVLSSFRPRSDLVDGSSLPKDQVLLPVVRLDDVTADLGEVDLLKVDVEGFEYEVLAGATELLKRTRLLVVEVTFQQLDSSSNLELFRLVLDSSPNARIVALGRVHGPRRSPVCADVLIDLRGPRSTEHEGSTTD